MSGDEVFITVRPAVAPRELADFYARNHVCSGEDSQERAERVLRHTDLFVVAWRQGRVAGLVRADFDGIDGHICEFCVDRDCQGASDGRAGATIAGDSLGVGRAMGEAALRELLALGAQRITVSPRARLEECFLRSLGFTRRANHRQYRAD